MSKIRQTPPQKALEEADDENMAAQRVADSMIVKDIVSGNVLILDDTLRSGGTMKEIARVLRKAGATNVFGLSAAKDAKFTFGMESDSLSRDKWQ